MASSKPNYVLRRENTALNGRGLKRCGYCRRRRRLTSFPYRDRKKGYRSHLCFKCTSTKGKRNYRKYIKGYRAYNKKTIAIIDGKPRTRNGARYIMMRDFVIAFYGGACECCGEDRKEFLCMDHREGGGNAHRRKIGGNLYPWLYGHRATKFPWMRVLCHNCNMSRSCRGYCPHDRERAADAEPARG